MNVAQAVALPPVPADWPAGAPAWRADGLAGRCGGAAPPRVFVVSIQCPTNAPKMIGRKKDDGPTRNITLWFHIRPAVLACFENAASRAKHNAARIFLNFVSKALVDDAVRSTFKLIGLTDDGDLAKMHLGKFKGYNGKPVLITKTGTAFRGGAGGVEYFEMDINVHRFNFISRKVLHSMWDRFSGIRARLGFVVQGATPLCPLRGEPAGADGHGDNELPEQVLGCATLDRWDPRAWASAPPLPAPAIGVAARAGDGSSGDSGGGGGGVGGGVDGGGGDGEGSSGIQAAAAPAAVGGTAAVEERMAGVSLNQNR